MATAIDTQPSGGGSSSQPESASKEKRNRPKGNSATVLNVQSCVPETKLRQQKLPAWQPILTATTVIPAVFAVGIIFIPIGIALLLASSGGKQMIP